MVGRYLLGDTLLRWADLYWGTNCVGKQTFIGDTLLWLVDIYCGTHYIVGQIFIGGHIVM